MPETGFGWSSSFNSGVMSSISSFWETPVPHILKTETCWVSSKRHFLFLLPEAKWSGLDSWCFCSAFVPILGLSPVHGLYHVHSLYVHLEKGFNNQCSSWDVNSNPYFRGKSLWITEISDMPLGSRMPPRASKSLVQRVFWLPAASLRRFFLWSS